MITIGGNKKCGQIGHGWDDGSTGCTFDSSGIPAIRETRN